MEQLFGQIEVWIQGLGVGAYLAAPPLMAVVAILPIPAEAPAMLNGMLFGPVVGTAVTWLGAMAGAWASFELARMMGRPMAEKVLRPEALARADDFVVKAGWRGMLVARFIPLIAFTALNWGAGLTAIPRRTFLWTTAVGILPGAFLFTTAGSGVAAAMAWLGPSSTVVAVGVGAALAAAGWRRRRRRRSATGD